MSSSVVLLAAALAVRSLSAAPVERPTAETPSAPRLEMPALDLRSPATGAPVPGSTVLGAPIADGTAERVLAAPLGGEAAAERGRAGSEPVSETASRGGDGKTAFDAARVDEAASVESGIVFDHGRGMASGSLAPRAEGSSRRVLARGGVAPRPTPVIPSAHAALVAADAKAARRDNFVADKALILTAFAMLLGVGLYGLGGFYIALTAWFSSGERRRYHPLKLPQAEREALRHRVRERLAGVLARLGLSPDDAPQIEISNAWGSYNMAVVGRRIDSSAEISVGEDWAGRSDEEMESVLGHELGHLYHGDPWNSFRFGARLAFNLGLTMGLVVPLTVFVLQMLVQAAPRGPALLVAGPVLPVSTAVYVWLAMTAAPLAAGGLMRWVTHRREWRADRFSSALDLGAGLASFVRSMVATKPQRWWRVPFRSHPLDSSRAAALERAAARRSEGG